MNDQAEFLIKNKKFKELIFGEGEFICLDGTSPWHSESYAMYITIDYLKNNDNADVRNGFQDFFLGLRDDYTINKWGVIKLRWIALYGDYINSSESLKYWIISKEEMTAAIIKKSKSYDLMTLKKYNVLPSLDMLRNYIHLPAWGEVIPIEHLNELKKLTKPKISTNPDEPILLNYGIEKTELIKDTTTFIIHPHINFQSVWIVSIRFIIGFENVNKITITTPKKHPILLSSWNKNPDIKTVILNKEIRFNGEPIEIELISFEDDIPFKVEIKYQFFKPILFVDSRLN